MVSNVLDIDQDDLMKQLKSFKTKYAGDPEWDELRSGFRVRGQDRAHQDHGAEPRRDPIALADRMGEEPEDDEDVDDPVETGIKEAAEIAGGPEMPGDDAVHEVEESADQQQDAGWPQLAPREGQSGQGGDDGAQESQEIRRNRPPEEEGEQPMDPAVEPVAQLFLDHEPRAGLTPGPAGAARSRIRGPALGGTRAALFLGSERRQLVGDVGQSLDVALELTGTEPTAPALQAAIETQAVEGFPVHRLRTPIILQGGPFGRGRLAACDGTRRTPG